MSIICDLLHFASFLFAFVQKISMSSLQITVYVQEMEDQMKVWAAFHWSYTYK